MDLNYIDPHKSFIGCLLLTFSPVIKLSICHPILSFFPKKKKRKKVQVDLVKIKTNFPPAQFVRKKHIGGRVLEFSFWIFFRCKCCFVCKRWRISQILGPRLSMKSYHHSGLPLMRPNERWTRPDRNNRANIMMIAKVPGRQCGSCGFVGRGRGGHRQSCSQGGE